MAVHAIRTSLAGVALGALIAVPAAVLVAASAGAGGLVPAVVAGLVAAIDRVGWVLAPQILLAVAVVGVALQRSTCRIAGFPAPPTVAWLDPAVDRFKALKTSDSDEEGVQRQEDFRGKLSAFKSLYSRISLLFRIV